MLKKYLGVILALFTTAAGSALAYEFYAGNRIVATQTERTTLNWTSMNVKNGTLLSETPSAQNFQWDTGTHAWLTFPGGGGGGISTVSPDTFSRWDSLAANPYGYATTGQLPTNYTTVGSLSSFTTVGSVNNLIGSWVTPNQWVTAGIISGLQPAGNYTTTGSTLWQPTGAYTTVGSTLWLTVGAAVQPTGNYTTVGSTTFQQAGNYTTTGSTLWAPTASYTTIGSQLWLTVGYHPNWATTQQWVTTMGNATWTTLGHLHSYQPSGNYTTVGSTIWLTVGAAVQPSGNYTTVGSTLWQPTASYTTVGSTIWLTVGAAVQPSGNYTTIGSSNWQLPGNYTTIGSTIWLTVGAAVQPTGNYTTVGSQIWSTLGHGHSGYLSDGTAWTTGQWRSMLGSTTFWGSCDSTSGKVVGISDSGRVICGTDQTGSGSLPDPTGKAGQYLHSDGTATSGWLTILGSEVNQNVNWGTANYALLAKTVDTNTVCLGCHGINVMNNYRPGTTTTWGSSNTTPWEAGWYTFPTLNVVNRSNTVIKVKATGGFWTSVGGAGTTTFRLHWSTEGAVVATAPVVAWSSIMIGAGGQFTAASQRGWVMDCEINYWGTGASVPAMASCQTSAAGQSSPTITTGWATFNINTTINPKIIVSSIEGAWTSITANKKVIDCQSFRVETGSR